MKRSLIILFVALNFILCVKPYPVFAWTNPGNNPASGGGSIIAEQNSPGSIIYIRSNGNVGIGNVNSSAILQLKAGTAAAGTSPLKLTSGVNMTTPEAGAVEWNGTNLFITQTTGPTRKTFAYTDSPLTGSLSATNVSTGSFGANTGGGNYSFPANVGVGTSTPSSRLVVTSDSSISGVINTAITADAPGITSSDYALYLRGKSGVGSVNNLMVVRGDGSVGIGSTTPGEKLEVSGNVKINEFRIKRVSATSMGIYDSANVLTLECDEGI